MKHIPQFSLTADFTIPSEWGKIECLDAIEALRIVLDDLEEQQKEHLEKFGREDLAIEVVAISVRRRLTAVKRAFWTR